MIRTLLAHLRADRSERGETPVATMIGMAVLAILMLSAGPAILAFTQQSTISVEDRRTDKALAVLVDSARRSAWQTLQVGGPRVQQVDLAGVSTAVATWVQIDPDSTSRKIITMAVPKAAATGVHCDNEADPGDLPGDCLVRSAVATATATDVTPRMSPLVRSTADGVTGSLAVNVTGQLATFSVPSTPVRVAIVAHTSGDVALDLRTNGISRAQVDLNASQTGSDWRLGNVLVCPSWARAGTIASLDVRGSGVALSNLTILTTPAPGECS